MDSIATWEIKVSPSPSQTPGSRDGGIYLILRVGNLLVPGSYPPSGSPNISWTRHTLAGFFSDADCVNKLLVMKSLIARYRLRTEIDWRISRCV